MSGNGIRLFTKFVIDNDIVQPDQTGLKVQTLVGIRTVIPKIKQGKMISGKVTMGYPKFSGSEIPVSPDYSSGDAKVVDYLLDLGEESIRISCVNIGNPHAVLITDIPLDQFDLQRIGPLVEKHNMFPNRINFEIVNVISDTVVKARIFERGVGETLSSGTGSSACAIICMNHNLVENKIKVQVPGGSLYVSWDKEKEVYLEGPTVEVFTGKWPME